MVVLMGTGKRFLLDAFRSINLALPSDNSNICLQVSKEVPLENEESEEPEEAAGEDEDEAEDGTEDEVEDAGKASDV